MAINTKRLEELAKPRNERAQRRAQERRINREWLTYSQDIALALHYYMREKDLTQRELAEQLGVSSVYVGKLLKGGENLTLETICKIQHVVGEQLISVFKPYEMPCIIPLAMPYDASEDVEFSRVYYKDILSRNRYQRVSNRLYAYS